MNLNNLGIASASSDNAAHTFPEHRFRQWRYMRARALGRIGFILADNPESLLAATSRMIVTAVPNRTSDRSVGSGKIRAVARREVQ